MTWADGRGVRADEATTVLLEDFAVMEVEVEAPAEVEVRWIPAGTVLVTETLLCHLEDDRAELTMVQVELAALRAVAVAARTFVPDVRHMRSTSAALRRLNLALEELDREGGDVVMVPDCKELYPDKEREEDERAI